MTYRFSGGTGWLDYKLGNGNDINLLSDPVMMLYEMSRIEVIYKFFFAETLVLKHHLMMTDKFDEAELIVVMEGETRAHSEVQNLRS